MVGLIGKIHYFEDRIRGELDRQNPSHTLNGSNYIVLCHEVVLRGVLLTERAAKTIFFGAALLVSPLAFLKGGIIPPPSLALEYFRKNARHLAAESFEYIGVVVCSILLLPFERKSSSRLLSAQIWIEKQAERISGESSQLDAIQDQFSSAKTRVALLDRIGQFISSGKVKRYYDLWIDFRDDLYTMEKVLKGRRIGRNYDKVPCQEVLDRNLVEMTSVRLAGIQGKEICKLKESLSHLIQVGDFKRPLSLDNSLVDTDPPEKKIRFFKQFLADVDQTIDQLHEIHDPSKELFNEIKKLRNEIREGISPIQILRKDFPDELKKGGEIEWFYNYGNVFELGEDVSVNFVSDIKEKIRECRNLLVYKPRPLDRETALKHLGLSPEADRKEITKAYHALSLTHHPDRGGDQASFQRINNAYSFLLD